MKLTDLFISLHTILGCLSLMPNLNLVLLITVLSAALLTLTKAQNNKYSFLKNLSVLKYVHQLR